MCLSSRHHVGAGQRPQHFQPVWKAVFRNAEVCNRSCPRQDEKKTEWGIVLDEAHSILKAAIVAETINRAREPARLAVADRP